MWEKIMHDKTGQNVAMLAWFKSMPKIRQITLILALAMVFVSLAGLAVDDENKGAFSLIYFIAPFAWVLWIWCAIQARKERVGLALVLMWAVIDLSILINLISLTAPKVGQSLGVDATILMAYLPVLLPIGFLHSIIPGGLSLNGVFDSQTGIGELMLVWGEATIWAAAQSIFIYWVGRLSWRPRRGNHQ
jgi:hypothetical protein